MTNGLRFTHSFVFSCYGSFKEEDEEAVSKEKEIEKETGKETKKETEKEKELEKDDVYIYGYEKDYGEEDEACSTGDLYDGLTPDNEKEKKKKERRRKLAMTIL